MEDNKIVDLYWARNEYAIRETDFKYGRMLKSLSYSLLSSREDAEECVNDTYLDAWNAMPTARPTYLGAFLSKITRRISIDRWRRLHREKRGGVQTVLEELTGEEMSHISGVCTRQEGPVNEQAFADCIRTIHREHQASKVTTEDDLMALRNKFKESKGIKA